MLIPIKHLCATFNLSLKGVLHLGANNGREYAAYKDVGMSKIIFVEAIPAIYEELKSSCGRDAICINACVSDVTGEVRSFHIANNHGESSSLHEFGTHTINHPEVHFIGDIEVVTTRVDDLGLDLDGINYLVTDLQGHDLQAIKGCGDLSRYDAVYTEVSFDELYKGCALIGEVDEYLGSRGFVRAQTEYGGNMSWGDALYIRKKT